MENSSAPSFGLILNDKNKNLVFKQITKYFDFVDLHEKRDCVIFLRNSWKLRMKSAELGVALSNLKDR